MTGQQVSRRILVRVSAVQGIGKNWMFALLEACCPAWAIPMLVGHHLPIISGRLLVETGHP
jgi:hypothetical protein